MCHPYMPVAINPLTNRDDAMRLRRIERDLRNLEESIREQASGSQDGYALQVADDIRRILA